MGLWEPVVEPSKLRDLDTELTMGVGSKRSHIPWFLLPFKAIEVQLSGNKREVFMPELSDRHELGW
jgi:hypothetical protein